MFVLERVDTMNDEVANRLLKTLEEPASFVHLILLTDALGRVLETVVSRCQLVRFDPLPAARIAAALEAEGVEPERAGACARLALGNAARARFLASAEGAALRAEVERAVARGRAATASGAASRGGRCSSAPSERRAEAEEAVAAAARASGSSSSRRAASGEAIEKRVRGGGEARRPPRAHRGARPRRSSSPALAFRDLVCLAEGARGACWPPTAATALAGAARGARPAPAARGGRALRGRAPVARAERQRGPGAERAGPAAGGAGRLAGLAPPAPPARM